MTFREIRETQIASYLAEGMEPREAIAKAGGGSWAQAHPKQWLADHPAVQEQLAKWCADLEIDAKGVLTEQIHTYAALLAQEQRLHAMLGHDMSELYDASGAILAPKEWPEVWRKALIVEFEQKVESIRSHDGEDTEGKGGWESGGVILKVKRERALEIEKELRGVQKEKREMLAEIGRHVNVKAFPVSGDKPVIVNNVSTNTLNLAQVMSLDELEALKQKLLSTDR